jgi:hypothetical protein
VQIPIPYESVEGKTYSLFGKDSSTQGYYRLISELADRVLEKCANPGDALKIIQKYSKKKRALRKISSAKEKPGFISFVVHLLNASLAEYTSKADSHLLSLPLHQFWDRRLGTTREQYHMYMLEIELTNRVYARQFISSDKKIALLPYCLRDFSADCKSKPDDFDYQCKHCSKNCYQHYISILLKEHQVDAYIWRGSGIKKKAREVLENKQKLGILGIACIPELVFGMRKCQKYGIPVVGIPLDANRCKRWMGEFHKNSVNLGELELLIRQEI